MKRGKDDEKILEPLFPRLHVNDADKGGPRAPPRNKMALYEQLSIPSQRFNNQGLVPLSASNAGSLVPPGPSNQACGTERNLYFHHQVSSSTPMQPVEKFVAQKSCIVNVRSLARYDQRKTVGEEDDFMVPVFLNSGRAQSHDRTKSGMDNEKPSPVVATSCPRSVEIQDMNGKDPKRNGSLTASFRQEVRDLSKENPRQGTVINSQDISAREEINASKSVLKRNRGNNACSRQRSRNRLDQDDCETVLRGTYNSQLRGENHSGEGHSSPDEGDDDHDRCRSKTCVSPQQRNGEGSDGVSDTSMVDSVSSTDINPDDVVGIIGQKCFWKARRAIANQQRVFAVQVFELHRLIKVQRLIAASPHLLLEDGTYLGKSSPKSSPVKKLLPGEYVVKPLPCVAKRKDDSEKDNHHKMECSAENTVGRTASVSSGKNHNNSHHLPSNYMPFVANNNPPAAPAATETQMTAAGGGGGGGGGGSWCFPPQPPPGNQQWLIPVMSPSEGLIYKPYPGPGPMDSVCGGYYGQFMPAPMAVSNFMGGPCYGVPTPPPYHPGIGFPSPGPGYFPPYAMPTMNPNFSGQQHTEQVNQFDHPGNTQQQSSCNFPNSNNNSNIAAQAQTQPQPQSAKPHPQTQPAKPHPQMQPQPTKRHPQNRESSRVLQGSTGSSPGERGGSTMGNSRNALPLFPTAPAADNNRAKRLLTTRTTTATATTKTTTTTTTVTMPMPPTTTTPTPTTTATTAATRVIRVVPHNPKAASESAARIFRSIQEERKHYESTA